jgi:dimethylargininase
MIALTRPVSASLARCELTYLARQPVDVAAARRQHAEYERLLASLGARVVRLPALDDLPDATFVEDAAVVLDELAIVAPMGAPSRAGESESVASALAAYRPVGRLELPATLDGGDVVRVGRTLFVGRSGRTNDAAIEQLARVVHPHGYTVTPVRISGALHLKTAVTCIGRDTLLANREWVDLAPFGSLRVVDVAEPWAADALALGDTVVLPRSFPATAALLASHGFRVATVDLSELQKAEAGATCLSIILEDQGEHARIPRMNAD